MSEQASVVLILAVVVVFIVISQLALVGRGKGPTAGMAICRKCGQAFPRSFFGLNLMTGKLVKCPHCGAWAVLPAASPAEIERAQAPQQARQESASAPVSADEALRRQIEQSKYER